MPPHFPASAHPNYIHRPERLLPGLHNQGSQLIQQTAFTVAAGTVLFPSLVLFS
jgi:hypothetical protein